MCPAGLTSVVLLDEPLICQVAPTSDDGLPRTESGGMGLGGLHHDEYAAGVVMGRVVEAGQSGGTGNKLFLCKLNCQSIYTILQSSSGASYSRLANSFSSSSGL